MTPPAFYGNGTIKMNGADLSHPIMPRSCMIRPPRSGMTGRSHGMHRPVRVMKPGKETDSMDSIRYETTTEKSFEEAIASLVKSLEEQKFGVLWKLDFKEKLKEKGLDLDAQVAILEACNPHLAKVVLTRQIDMGYFLPCRLVVYVQDGVTRIGMLRPTALVGLLQHDELGEIARDVENMLVTAIDCAR